MLKFNIFLKDVNEDEIQHFMIVVLICPSQSCLNSVYNFGSHTITFQTAQLWKWYFKTREKQCSIIESKEHTKANWTWRLLSWACRSRLHVLKGTSITSKLYINREKHMANFFLYKKLKPKTIERNREITTLSRRIYKIYAHHHFTQFLGFQWFLESQFNTNTTINWDQSIPPKN